MDMVKAIKEKNQLEDEEGKRFIQENM